MKNIEQELAARKIGLVDRYVSDLEGHEPNERIAKAIEESLDPADCYFEC